MRVELPIISLDGKGQRDPRLARPSVDGDICGPLFWGNSFFLDLAGYVNCGCQQWAAPFGNDLWYTFEITGGAPTVFEFNNVSATKWEAEGDSGSPGTSYEAANGRTEDNCEPKDDGGVGYLHAEANCITDEESDFFGKLLVVVYLTTATSYTVPVYAAYFEELDSEQASVLYCGMLPALGDPVGFPAFYEGGTATLTPPPP